MSKQVPDLTSIINKLIEYGLVTKHEKGICGLFSIKENSHLLTPEELELWIKMLHNGMMHNDKCSDLHKWNIDFVEVN